jgi:putative hydrolase of the HAD superfamily
VTAPALQAVTFDVGGTLIQPWPSVGAVYADVASRRGILTANPAELERRFRSCWRAREESPHSRTGWEALVDEVFQGLCSDPPSRTFFPELYDRFASPETWRIFDDVDPALEDLRRKGLRIGVISNWDERLRPLMRGLGLANQFQSMTISCEAGFAKPAPGIFAAAAEQLGVRPESILHVGDDWERDVRGAAAAGFRSVQIRRDAGVQVASTLTDLRELTTWIAMDEAKSD